MLVLSRRIGEMLMIGETTIIRVHAVRGKRVVLGIEAPDDLRILRGELSAVREAMPLPCIRISFGESDHSVLPAIN